MFLCSMHLVSLMVLSYTWTVINECCTIAEQDYATHVVQPTNHAICVHLEQIPMVSRAANVASFSKLVCDVTSTV